MISTKRKGIISWPPFMNTVYGVYFVVIAFLVVELFRILLYANQMTSDVTKCIQNGVNHKMQNICANIKCTGLKIFRIDVLQELHIVDMMSPYQHTGYQTSTFPK